MFSELTKANLWLKVFAFTKIPLIFFCRPKVVALDDEKCIIRIPLRRRTRNHMNSMYFGVLSTGADCAGGLLAMKVAKESGKKVSLVFKDFHADFYKRSMGNVVFTCNMGREIEDLVERSLKSSDRLNLPVIVTATVPSISDEVVANFTLTLSVKTK